MKPGFGNIESVFRGGGKSKPVFTSAEIGLIDAYTIDILFDIALNETKIPDAVDLIPTFSGGATQIYDRTITGTHLYAKTGVADWYLPSRDELLEAASVLDSPFGAGVRTFIGDYYNTSSEFSTDMCMVVDFGTEGHPVSNEAKGSAYETCAIRSFTSLKSYALSDVGPAGGWIFYKDGNNYLECAPTDEGSLAWSNIANVEIGVTAQGTAIGTGQANTTAIIGQSGHTASAAKLCNDLVIGRAIQYGETGTIQYIPNTDNAKKLQGLTGAKVDTFTENVTNNVPLPPLVDLGGNQYTTVIIGNQEWTVENFRCTKYADGTDIIDGALFENWFNAAAYCFYNNDPDMLVAYGMLYSGLAIQNIKGLAYFERNGVQEVGWRIPTPADYDILIAYLGDSTLAGKSLRDISWGVESTNSSGFTGLPGGYRKYDGQFLYLGLEAYFANMNVNNSWCNLTTSGISNYSFLPAPNSDGYSVRFVKDVSV